jgi:hypothetical protein
MSRVNKSNRVTRANSVAKSNRVATSNRQYGFTPKDISGCVWWLRADDVTVKQGGVSEINDKSGNGHIVTQSTNSLRAPLISSVAAFNNKPVIRFSDAQWYEKIGGITLPYSSNPMTAFMVGSISTIPDAGPNGFFSYFTNTTGTLHAYARIQATGNFRVAIESTPVDTSLSASPANSAHIFAYTFTQGSLLTYRDGIAGATGTPSGFLSAGATPLLRVGTTDGATTPTSSFYGGDIAEIIVYNSVLSTENRQKVEQYLKLRYNIA